jgi:uncharacterized delta-60 repeat protein
LLRLLGVVCAAALVVAPSASLAAPGDLDAGFGNGGIRTTDLGFGGLGTAAAVARQADGKLLAVGQVEGQRIVIVRLNGDGTLDDEFSGDGRIIAAVGAESAAVDVAVQPDGKIVVAASSEDSSFQDSLVLLRYDADGTPDATFSGDGQLVASVGFGARPTAMALQADGRIVVVADEFDTAYVASYTSDGAPDSSFSGDGVASFGEEQLTRPSGVAIDSDGKVVVVGQAESETFGGADDFAVARLTTFGEPDSTFSGDGVEHTEFVNPDPDGSNEDTARDVVIQADGKIVVGGGAGYDEVFALARYTTTGVLDTSFSGDGRQTTQVGDGDYEQEGIQALSLTSDGKIVAVGDVYYGSEIGLARYSADGTLDPAFSADGTQRVALDDAGDGSARDLLVAPDGRIEIAGNRADGFMVARLVAAGDPDASFSGDGFATVAFSGGERGSAAVELPDGELFVVGTHGQQATAVRYSSDGTLDPTFSGDGYGLLDSIDRVAGAALQDDGKVIVSGSLGGGDEYEGRWARFTAAGDPDASFNDGFPAVGVRFTGGLTFGEGVAKDPDGRIVFVDRAETFDGDDGECGDDSSDGGIQMEVSRLPQAGGADTTFLDAVIRDFSPSAVTTQADRKIVIAGDTCTGDIRVIRLLPNGVPDPSFDGDGVQTTDFGGDADFAAAVAVQSDGKIVVAGSASQQFALARYDTDGSLDGSFDGDGKLTTTFGGISARAVDVAIHSGGKIVAFGDSADASTRDLAIARYDADGSLDSGFSGDGRALTDVSGRDTASDVLIQPDGDIVGVGTSNGVETGADIALVSYDGGDAGGPAAQAAIPADATPPTVSITSGPAAVGDDDTPTFAFASSEAGSSYQCRIDGGAFAPCSSPHTTVALGAGPHTFEVQAFDPSGNPSSPATRSFTIGEPGAPQPGPGPVGAGGPAPRPEPDGLARDRDGDGVPDVRDRCLSAKGPALRKGCPSNVFTRVGRPVLKKASTTVTVSVPGPGAVKVRQAAPLSSRTVASRTSALVRPLSLRVSRAGRATLRIKPSAAGRKRLERKRRFTVRVLITYTPQGGKSHGVTMAISIER